MECAVPLFRGDSVRDTPRTPACTHTPALAPPRPPGFPPQPTLPSPPHTVLEPLRSLEPEMFQQVGTHPALSLLNNRPNCSFSSLLSFFPPSFPSFFPFEGEAQRKDRRGACRETDHFPAIPRVLNYSRCSCFSTTQSGWGFQVGAGFHGRDGAPRGTGCQVGTGFWLRTGSRVERRLYMETGFKLRTGSRVGQNSRWGQDPGGDGIHDGDRILGEDGILGRDRIPGGDGIHDAEGIEGWMGAEPPPPGSPTAMPSP